MPIMRSQSMKSRSFRERIWARICMDRPAQPNSERIAAKMNMLEMFIFTARIMNTGVCGSVRMILAMKEMMVSTQPPMKPEAAPRMKPPMMVNMAASTATVSTSREPCTTWAQMSMPW